jgi:hypothetical protein
MSWSSSIEQPGVGLGIEWAAGGDDARQADPYLFWAALTGFRSYRPPQRPGLRLAAFELHPQVEGRAFLDEVQRLNAERWRAGRPALLQIAPHHAARLSDLPACRHFVGWMRVEDFAGSPLAERVRRYRVALVGATEGVAPAAADSVAIGPGILAPATAARRRSASSAADAPIIGVIDIGCAFAHPRVASPRQGPWRTRVSHFWDMGREAGPAEAALWQPCAAFGYGRETDAARLDALIAAAVAMHAHRGAPGNAAVERSCYESAGLPELLSARKRWSHGTMVMDFAAGPIPEGDAACRAEIVFVQLPPEAVEDLSCGWLTPHVIDALLYILAKAAGRPAVINLSFGAYAGSHDGESLLEAALDAIAEESGAVLVLSAGNARGHGLHATATIEPGESKSLDWVLPRDDPTQSFLELWYEQKGTPAGPPSVAVSLRHDDLPPMAPQVGAGAAWFTFDHAPQRPVAALLQVPGTTAGGPDGLVLVGLGPTDRETTLPNWEPVRAPSGYWTVTVDNRGAGALTVHAWVERDDPDLAARSEFAQSRLVDVAGGFKVEDAGTLTGQACGAKTIVVGSRVQNDPDGLAPDSGVGPARRGSRTGPDLVAAGVRRAASVGLVGIEATANLSGGQPVRLSGTSISAPRVTRKAFEALATQGVVGGAAGLLTRWFGPAPKGGGLARDSRFGLGRLDDNGQVGPQSEDPPQRNDDLDGGTDARTPHQRAGSARASTSAGPCTAT